MNNLVAAGRRPLLDGCERFGKEPNQKADNYAGPDQGIHSKPRKASRENQR